jgi:hypothetical protein
MARTISPLKIIPRSFTGSPLLIPQLDNTLALSARLAAGNGSAPRLGNWFVAFFTTLS